MRTLAALSLSALLLAVPLATSAGQVVPDDAAFPVPSDGPADARTGPLGPAGQAVTSPAATVTVAETDDAIHANASAYAAEIDKPHGNLVGLWNARGHRLLGTDAGRVQGLRAEWLAGSQQDGGGGAEPTIEVDPAARTVTVDHALFVETYVLHADRVEVRFAAKDGTTVADGLHLVAGSVLEPSREAARRFSIQAYDDLGAYPTDFTTDRSSGQFSLWTTATSTVYAHTYRVAMAEPVLEGWCRWYTQHGVVRFDPLPGGERGSGLPLVPACTVANQTDVEAAGVPVAGATHQVVQDVGPFAAGDVLRFEVTVDAAGYDAREVAYPISTRISDAPDKATTKGKVLVPWQAPPEGPGLVVFHPGHWDEMYTHSYLWDFLANHGYVVATPHTTADMGDVHARHDWGYMEQVEFADLRRWAMRTYDVDPDRVISVGISLGGLNGLLDAVNHPDAYAATVFYSGVYDFERYWHASALGPASMAAGVEIGPCCGGPPLDEDAAYAWEIRDPKRRIDQLEGELVIVHGAGDVVAPFDHSLELHRAVPGSTFHVAAGAHENNVFAGFRKEVRDAVLAAERTNAQRDRVDVAAYGRPDLVPDGYEPMADRLDHTTEWLKAWVPDQAWTRIVAERGPGGVDVRVQADADGGVRIAVRLPGDCAPDCTATVNGRAVPVEQVAFAGADAPAAVFDLPADGQADVAFVPGGLPAAPTGVALPLGTALPLLALLSSVVLSLLYRRPPGGADGPGGSVRPGRPRRADRAAQAGDGP